MNQKRTVNFVIARGLGPFFIKWLLLERSEQLNSSHNPQWSECSNRRTTLCLFGKTSRLVGRLGVFHRSRTNLIPRCICGAPRAQRRCHRRGHCLIALMHCARDDPWPRRLYQSQTTRSMHFIRPGFWEAHTARAPPSNLLPLLRPQSMLLFGTHFAKRYILIVLLLGLINHVAFALARD